MDLVQDKVTPVTISPTNTDLMYTAMCLWEAFLTAVRPYEADPFDTPENHDQVAAEMAIYLYNVGVCEARDAVVKMVPRADQCFREIIDQELNVQFDWAFCPWFLSNCVSWDDYPILKDEPVDYSSVPQGHHIYVWGDHERA